MEAEHSEAVYIKQRKSRPKAITSTASIFGTRHFTLYQHLHLGQGLTSARNAIIRRLSTNTHESTIAVNIG
jgi:hypothetical protein